MVRDGDYSGPALGLELHHDVTPATTDLHVPELDEDATNLATREAPQST
jgi:hypothetical protein